MKPFGFRRSPVSFYQQAAAITAERSKHDEGKKPHIPPSVKYIGSQHDESVLQTRIPIDDEPIYEEYDGQENQKLYRGENHRGDFALGLQK